MTTYGAPNNQSENTQANPQSLSHATRSIGARILRELLILATFCSFTAMITWPYVLRLRDVVVDEGDPYLITWILWWDYHQTFTDPLHLFNGNIFYPLKYSLAFSENSYGIAMLFFPLYALGVKPLTVHAIALFFGFALSGYGGFRLGRTLTGSSAVGWISGIIFAFVPYRFNMMSQVAYVFSPWIPLVFEALVLFVRQRSKRRAAWLGCAFFMSGLTTISWFNFSLIPLAVFAAILLTRYALWRDRDFWWRGPTAIIAATVLLLPFFIPYIIASRLYGFKRTIEEIKANSAWPIHWLSVESRNRLWRRMGDGNPEGWKFKLFPGLLPILFSLAALRAREPNSVNSTTVVRRLSSQRWVRRLDVLIVVATALSILAIGFDGTDAFGKIFFHHIRSERALALLCASIIARLCLSYPDFLRRDRANLVETIRSKRRGDAFWLGLILTVIGFCYSLGWNFFFYRICYALIPMFRSIRVVSRGAIVAYLGLALLSGLGVKHLAERLRVRFPRLRVGVTSAIACGLLLIELNVAPLGLMRGDLNPDAVTLRMKQTPMRGGIVILPAGGDFNYRYMLRATEHQKPLIVGTSGFNSPIEDRIEGLTREGAIPTELLDLFESIPASYVVVENQSIPPDRNTDYQNFLARAMASDRLRFINRFDGHSDLYAVVKTEPETKSEAAPPVDTAGDWKALVARNPLNMLGQFAPSSEELYRVVLVATGALPRYADFSKDVQTVGSGIEPDSGASAQRFRENLNRFAEELLGRDKLGRKYEPMNDTQFVESLLGNVQLSLDETARGTLIRGLSDKTETRASVLLKIANEPRLIQREHERALVLLHYFAYLRRNPGEPPDQNSDGFEYWIREVKKHGGQDLGKAFATSSEYHKTQTMP